MLLSPGTFPVSPVPPEDGSERDWPGIALAVPSPVLAAGGGDLGRGFCPCLVTSWAILPLNTWGPNSHQRSEHWPRRGTHAVLANATGASQPSVFLGCSLQRGEPGCETALAPVGAGMGERQKARAEI